MVKDYLQENVNIIFDSKSYNYHLQGLKFLNKPNAPKYGNTLKYQDFCKRDNSGKNESNEGALVLSYIKTYFKVTITQTERYWHMDKWIRTDTPDIDTNRYRNLMCLKWYSKQGRKGSLLNM